MAISESLKEKVCRNSKNNAEWENFTLLLMAMTGGRDYKLRHVHISWNLWMSKKDTVHGVGRENYSHAEAFIWLQQGLFGFHRNVRSIFNSEIIGDFLL